MRAVLPLLVSFLVGCSSSEQSRESSPNRWADERLWPVLEAQEKRDTGTLCALLYDSSSTVREAAALAFASVQDSASVGCLLKALTDPVAVVRSTAVFALGFVADSVSIQRMAEIAVNERDSTVQRAFMSASFLAMQRNGMLRDPNSILYYFDRAIDHERVRAADALRRLPDSMLRAMAPDYMALFPSETPMESEAVLVRGLGKVGSPEALKLLRFSADPDKPAVIIPNALHTLGGMQHPEDDSLLFYWVGPGCIGQMALEALSNREDLNAEQCLHAAMEESDTRTRIVLLGLALKHGGGATGDSALSRLDALNTDLRDPYLKAEMIYAVLSTSRSDNFAKYLSAIQSKVHPAVRQAAFHASLRIARDNMMRSRFASREAQYSQLGDVVSTAVNTGDVGLICAVAELLVTEDPEVIELLFPTELEKTALAPLLPIRDLEAHILLKQVVAKRDGSSPPTHAAPPFNHPINKEKLRALPQSQRYRITTSKGTIIIATDVNDCPGSSLAFDSLVAAGYYNGKAFHRMVPNFVVQGGCPRGDGYGGMPWTLRTEIGRKLFTAGSIGLASAGRDTESCQFFITHTATPHLDGRYTRFGEVVSGMDVVWRLQVGDVMTRVERLP